MFKPDKNETVRPYGHKAVKLVSVVKRTRYQITLHNVIFAPDFIFNLVFASRVRKNGFRISIDVSKKHPRTGTVELFHKPLRQIMMNENGTSDGLFELAVWQKERVLTVKSSIKFLWLNRMRYCSDNVLQKSLPHVYKFQSSDIGSKKNCGPCALSKSSQKLRKQLQKNGR